MLKKHQTLFSLFYPLVALCFSFFVVVGCDNFRQTDVGLDNDKQISDVALHKYSIFQEGKEAQWVEWSALKVPDGIETIIEVTRFANIAQSETQKDSADDLYNKTLENIRKNKWYSVERAIQDGYVLGDNPSHALNPNFILDGELLNPDRPEYLMFYSTQQGMVLSGVMFIQDVPDSHGEQIGGPETVWHFHEFPDGVCYPLYDNNVKNNLVKEGYTACKEGVFFNRSPEMLHVWFVEHPNGRFATAMTIDDKLLSSGVFSDKLNPLSQKLAPQSKNMEHHH